MGLESGDEKPPADKARRVRTPYADLPAYQIWRRSVVDGSRADVDPQHGARFSIDRRTRIASAGSCFAAEIASRLRSASYAYHVTEPGPMWESREARAARHYGHYSARYSDLYTALHLLQLAQRCVGRFSPEEPAWHGAGVYRDPFRPRIEPNGFPTLAALEADRATHLAAVRRLFSETDVFIFTLGLTETWRSRLDGAAFPVCPGTQFGTFDEDRYYFENLSVEQTVAALEEFLAIARELNPELRVILTISPVPLAATMEPRHVLQSTVYSKSVLRVAAEHIYATHANVDYFASYEIVTMLGNLKDSFEPDGRTVKQEAVDRVMASFFRAYAADDCVPIATLNETPHAATVTDPCDDDFLLNYIAEQRKSNT
jgi:hypothetical protein